MDTYVNRRGEVYIEENEFEELVATVGFDGIVDGLRDLIIYPYIYLYITNPDPFFENLKRYKPTISHEPYRYRMRYRYGPKFCGEYTTLIHRQREYSRMNLITDIFAEPMRLMCPTDGKPAPIDRWKDREVLMEAFKIAYETYHCVNTYVLRESLRATKMINECTLYKATIPVYLTQLLKCKRVLDLSCGWGDRLIGFLAAGVEVYHGCDPNDQLTQVYGEIIDRYGEGIDVTIECVKSEDYQLKHEGYYDIFHSSPPFFTKEMYHNMDTWNGVDEWLTGFLFPYLSKACRGVKRGGYLTIYMGDFAGVSYCDSASDYLKDELGCEYMGTIAIKGGSTFPLWMWKTPV
jgi:hypothetical protein